jgi:hypothetical protein
MQISLSRLPCYGLRSGPHRGGSRGFRWGQRNRAEQLQGAREPQEVRQDGVRRSLRMGHKRQNSVVVVECHNVAVVMTD